MVYSMSERTKAIAKPQDWRTASRAVRATRAVPLELPSGTTILAARPEPLEWILSGRLPQRLLATALESGGTAPAAEPAEISREEILELARFAARLVQASVVEPAIGEGPGEMRFEEIPVEDRVFIFEWACRSLREPGGDGVTRSAPRNKEELSSPSVDGLEGFCAK